MTMRTMYDSVTAANIPAGAELVAGYVDGRYAWSEGDWARFPRALHVPIAVFSTTNDGVVGDVETGDMTPLSSVDWVLMRRAAGIDPTLYVSASAWWAVAEAFARRLVDPPWWWVANWDNDPAIPTGAMAHQYQSTAAFDASSVLDYWPGIDQAPVPGPIAHHTRSLLLTEDPWHSTQ